MYMQCVFGRKKSRTITDLWFTSDVNTFGADEIVLILCLTGIVAPVSGLQ